MTRRIQELCVHPVRPRSFWGEHCVRSRTFAAGQGTFVVLQLGAMAELLFKDPRDYLKFEFEMRRSRRPAYSMRAFARDLKVSASSLNDFMKGRVGMSKLRISAIATILKWSPARQEHFYDLIAARFEPDRGARQAALMRTRQRLREGSFELSLDAFKTISDWYHLVILELCDLCDHSDVSSLAGQLKLPVATVRQAVRRLCNLKLLVETDQGFKPTEQLTFFGDEKPSEAVLYFHAQILGLAQNALFERPMHERGSLSLTFSVAQEEMTAMNEEIKRTVMNIVNRYAQAPKRDSVQVLSFQSFPLYTANVNSKEKQNDR